MPGPQDPVVLTRRLRLALLAPDDAPRALDFFVRNRAHFAPWDPPRPAGFYQLPWWREQLARYRAESVDERSLRLFLTGRDTPLGPVLGLVHFSRLVRGPFQCAGVGYSLDGSMVGRGLMQEALRGAIGYVFDDLGYHRVEANYRPENRRSARVLAALGFVVEGYARRYLMIDGDWRDHVLTSLTRPTLAAAASASPTPPAGAPDSRRDGR
jgi:ribosomal-protein-alanine N-acetyltransferase